MCAKFCIRNMRKDSFNEVIIQVGKHISSKGVSRRDCCTRYSPWSLLFDFSHESHNYENEKNVLGKGKRAMDFEITLIFSFNTGQFTLAYVTRTVLIVQTLNILLL